jgi:hypothetical protein
MKVIYVLLGAVLGAVAGTLAVIPFNYWYLSHHVRSDDDANFLVSLLLFGVWPLAAVAGGLVGYWLYRRRLANRRTRTPVA